MATIASVLAPTKTLITNKVVWTPLANGDSGSAVDPNDYRDRSVQVLGTFGASGSVTLQTRAVVSTCMQGSASEPGA